VHVYLLDRLAPRDLGRPGDTDGSDYSGPGAAVTNGTALAAVRRVELEVGCRKSDD